MQKIVSLGSLQYMVLISQLLFKVLLKNHNNYSYSYNVTFYVHDCLTGRLQFSLFCGIVVVLVCETMQIE